MKILFSWYVTMECIELKAAGTNIRYVARSKFFGNLVHKKNFGSTWQVVFKLGYLFCQVWWPRIIICKIYFKYEMWKEMKFWW